MCKVKGKKMATASKRTTTPLPLVWEGSRLAEFSDGDYGAFVVFQERETQDPTEPGGATATASKTVGETAERDTMAATESL